MENLGILTVLLTFIAVLAFQHRIGNSWGAFPCKFMFSFALINSRTRSVSKCYIRIQWTDFIFVCMRYVLTELVLTDAGLAKTPMMTMRAFFSEKVLKRKYELTESLRSDEDLYDPNISFFFLENEKPGQGLPK